MRFWDASAVVPVCIGQTFSGLVRSIYEGDPQIVVWWGTRTECLSAFARLVREGRHTAASDEATRRLLRELLAVATEVAPTEEVRDRADRLLAVHPLRAADALQLGAALIWTRERPSGVHFVSLDARLRDAAAKEGFAVVPDLGTPTTTSRR